MSENFRFNSVMKKYIYKTIILNCLHLNFTMKKCNFIYYNTILSPLLTKIKTLNRKNKLTAKIAV